MEEKLSGKERAEIAIEAGLQLIPYVGSSLATLYFSTKQEKRFKRIESFYAELAEEVRDLQERLAPVESHDQEKLASLIEDLNDRVEREHLELKRRYFKNFMRNTLLTPTNNNYDERKYFLDALSALSLLECEMLAFLKQKAGMVEVRTIQKPGTPQYAIVGAIGRLSTYGFVRTVQLSMTIGGGADNALAQGVELSDYGVRFVRFCLE